MLHLFSSVSQHSCAQHHGGKQQYQHNRIDNVCKLVVASLRLDLCHIKTAYCDISWTGIDHCLIAGQEVDGVQYKRLVGEHHISILVIPERQGI